MSIRVRDLDDITDYSSLEGGDRILVSQWEPYTGALITKNVFLSVLDSHISSEQQGDFDKVYKTLSGYALSTHTHQVTEIEGMHWPVLTDDIEDFGEHTHTRGQITDFDHTHYREDIVDFDHQHSYEDISDYTKIPLTKKNITDFSHEHSCTEISDWQEIELSQSNIVDFAHKHPFSDISNLSDIELSQSNIVDFAHTHEMSDVNNLTSYINKSISAFSVASIYDAKDAGSITLSSNTLVISRPKKNVGVLVKSCDEGQQRHFYLYVVNSTSNSIVFSFGGSYTFKSYDSDALAAVPKNSDILLEFVELNTNLFFVVRHDSKSITPARVRTYAITCPVVVDEYGNRFDETVARTTTYDEGYVFTFGAAPSYDESEETKYRFKCWKYDGNEYQPGQTFIVSKDASVYAVYVKDKKVFFERSDTEEVLRVYRIQSGSTIYLQEDNSEYKEVLVEKMEYPQPKDIFSTYTWDMSIPEISDIDEDVVITGTLKTIDHYDQDPFPDGEEPEVEKNDEPSALSNLLLLDIGTDTTAADILYLDFATDDDTYITIV